MALSQAEQLQALHIVDRIRLGRSIRTDPRSSVGREVNRILEMDITRQESLREQLEKGLLENKPKSKKEAESIISSEKQTQKFIEEKRQAQATTKPQVAIKQKVLIKQQDAKTKLNNLLFTKQQSNPLSKIIQDAQRKQLAQQQSTIKKSSVGKKIKDTIVYQTGWNMYENKAKQEENKISQEIKNYANSRQAIIQSQVDSGKVSVGQANKILEADIDKKYNILINQSEFFGDKNKRDQTTNSLAYEYETQRLEAVKKGEKTRAGALRFLKVTADLPTSVLKSGVGVKNYLTKLIRDPKTRETSAQTLKKILPTSFKDYTQKMDVLQKKVYIKTKELTRWAFINPQEAVGEVAGSLVGFGILSKGTKPVLKATKVFSKKASKEIITKLNIKPIMKKGLTLPSLIEAELSPTIYKQISTLSKTSKGVVAQATKGIDKVSKVTKKVKPTTKLKPVTRLKQIEKGTRTIKNVNLISKDIKKLIPKTISKVRIARVEKSMKPIIDKFLKNKQVLLDLNKKFPKKKTFTIKEIKKSKFYPQLKSILRRRAFSKYDIKAIRKKGKKIRPVKNRIKGVKVPKKEFRSFKEAEKQFLGLKRLGKFVKKITHKGGVGKIESLPKRPINKKELAYFNVGKRIPKPFLKDVDKVSINTFVQKFSARIPIIKRFGDIKKGTWRTILEDKTFFQNSVSFSLYKKGGNSVGTITFNTISSKPITRFRNIESALKWGTNKNVVLSKLTGDKFVRSYVLKSRGSKITMNEFLSKIKITPNGKFEDILIFSKKIPKYTSRKSVKKQFKRAIPVSVTKGRIKKIPISTIAKWNKKKGYLEIIQRGQTIKLIKTKSIINPVIIDTSKIETIVRRMNKIKLKTLSKARANRIKQAKKIIISTKKSRTFSINGKNKVAIPKAKLQLINKVEKETKVALKESLSGRSISPKIKITKRIQGIKQLNKLKRIEKVLKKERINLAKRHALDTASKTAISQSLRLVSRMKVGLKKQQLVTTIQKSKQLQKVIQQSLNKAKSKTALVTIKSLQRDFPILAITPKIKMRPIPRPAKTTRKAIMIPTKNKGVGAFKTFSKPVKIFSIIVKKRGKNLVLKNKLTERDALNFMSYELDNQLLRSGRLKQIGTSKKARKISPKYNGAYEKKKRKLRQYKIMKKKKVAIRGFIEKKRFALDSPREKAQLRGTKKRKISKKKIVKKRATRKSLYKKKVARRISLRKPLRRKVVKNKLTKKKRVVKKRR